jgi:hypothetical protein
MCKSKDNSGLLVNAETLKFFSERYSIGFSEEQEGQATKKEKRKIIRFIDAKNDIKLPFILPHHRFNRL